MKLDNRFTKKSLVVLILSLAIALFFHAKNMFHYPFFENDEGAYMAQAWSLLSEGKLAPYTYWYDHAPAGWIFTSIWILLTGGLFTFGYSLNSGRILMLILHLLSSLFLFLITKKISKSDLAAGFAVLLFSITPLGVYFQRRLLLDNIMVFWLLLSILLITVTKKRLRYTALSAVCFGIAVLTKENAVFYYPVMLGMVYIFSHKEHNRVTTSKWLMISGLIIAIYPLYALLKRELFPPGVLFSPDYPHVSLVGTLQQQASRGTGLPVFNYESDFMVNFRYWVGKDAFIIYFGFLSVLINGVLGIKNKASRFAFFLALPTLIFLLSGKLVINFYIVPLIPFLAISISIITHHLLTFVSRKIELLYIIGFIAVFLISFVLYLPHTEEYLTRDETTKQLEAIAWIKENLDPETNIAIDFYSNLDLRNSRYPNDPLFKNADWFWKVELDPDIRVDKLEDDTKNLEYVMLTAELERQLEGYDRETSMLINTLRDSKIRKIFAFEEDFNIEIKIGEQKYPNGDWVVIYEQIDNFDLNEMWEYYKDRFIYNDGSTFVVEDPNGVTSEAQSYAMFRALLMSDKDTFDKAYGWLNNNLKMEDSNLYYWKWLRNERRVLDGGNATDADVEIAYSLLLAHEEWGEEKYKEDAINILNDIWKYNVYSSEETSIITAGNWAIKENYLTLNPSYFMPYAYRKFALYDPEHDWTKVMDTGYEYLEKCSKSKLDKDFTVVLPPEWCRVNLETFEAEPSIEPEPESSDYGYNAFRTPFRLTLDYYLHEETRAIELINSYRFIVNEYEQNGEIYDVYSHSGEVIEGTTRFGNIVSLPVLQLTDPIYAQDLYDKLMDTYGGDYSKMNYYEANWLWYVVALYQGYL